IMRVERGGIPYPKGIEIKDGEQVSDVRVVLSYGSGTIHGVVKLEGGTLPANAGTYIGLRRLGEETYSLTPWSNAPPIDDRGQFSAEGLLPGSYEISAGIYIPGEPAPFRRTKQQIVVTDGGVTNVTITVNLNSTSDRP